MGWPLLLMWCMVRYGLAFTFNVVYGMLWVGLYFRCGVWYVMGWPLLLMWCMVRYGLTFTFDVLYGTLWVGLYF